MTLSWDGPGGGQAQTGCPALPGTSVRRSGRAEFPAGRVLHAAVASWS